MNTSVNLTYYYFVYCWYDCKHVFSNLSLLFLMMTLIIKTLFIKLIILQKLIKKITKQNTTTKQKNKTNKKRTNKQIYKCPGYKYELLR